MLLVTGEPDLSLTAQLGEVVRVYLTNTGNTLALRVKLPGARMKLVGGDSGRCEREEFVAEVVAPSERIVADALFDEPGQMALGHHTPDRCYPLAAITVASEPTSPSLGREFALLRSDPELTAEARCSRHPGGPPDRN